MNIKQTIKKYKLTSIEVAKRMGVSETSFSYTINGNPTVDTLERIAAAIGCDVVEFFTKPEKDANLCPDCGCKLLLRIEKE